MTPKLAVFHEAMTSRAYEAQRIASEGKPEPTPYEYALSVQKSLYLLLVTKKNLSQDRGCLVEQIGRLLAAVEGIDRPTPTLPPLGP